MLLCISNSVAVVSPHHSVFMIIYAYVNRVRHAATIKVNKQITGTEEPFSSVLQQCQADSMRGWRSNYT